MSDPAVEAAKQAVGDRHWWLTRLDDELIGQVSEYATAAAREALNPIRELHRVGVFGYCKECGHEGGRWPCATAKLAYPESDLL